MSKDYIFEPRPIFSSYTPNLLLGSYYIEDGFQADPSMWMDPLEDAFVNNAGMKVGKDDNENFYLNEFSAEAVLMGTKKLDALEVIPQSPSWKWANYDNELQIPKDIADDDFESAAYERFMEAAVGYNSDDPYFLSVVNSFMDDGEDVDLWAEEADWNRIQTTVLWWKLYDQWMENEGIDFLTGYAEENYDWAVTHSYELGNIGYEMPEPDDDDYYWSMRQAESRHGSYDKPITERQRYRIRKLGGRIDKSMNRSDASRYIKSLMVNPLHAENESHWMTFGRVDYNWATDPDDLELADEDFWVIDEHIRNEVRYEIDTNNLPGESNISSSDISLSLTEEDEDDFTIYYYWGPAETTGVNSAESFEASVHKDECTVCVGFADLKDLAPDYEVFILCDDCITKAKTMNAESFEAPYTGAGALMGISGDSDLSSFTSKELTESSAIHGDFDQASLNYSGHQNLEVRAETLGKDSCCCGATKSKPCACMATGAKCSGSCACDSAAKKAESFEAEYIHIYDTTITEPEILKKLEGAGIKPTDYYWLTEDIFGLHINSSDADAFQEEFNKKDWTGLYEFEAESFSSEGPYECGQCREYGDYDPGEAPAAEEECDDCGDSICIGCYRNGGGLCMRPNCDQT